MKIRPFIVAAAATMALGGGLAVAQASASQASPSPTLPAPSATASLAPAERAGKGTGVGWFYRALTRPQRTCLADADVQRPAGRLTAEQRTKLQDEMRAALSGCGVELPARLADRPRLGLAWAALTPTQQDCLAGVTITRPVGRLTDAERAAVRDALAEAVAACR